MENITDAGISGMGRMGGGKYRNISISGKGEIDGDVTAETLSVSGMGTVRGNAFIGKIKTSGTCRITGSVEGDSLSDSGTLSIGGNLKSGNISVSGTISVKGGIKSNIFHSSGFITCTDGVEAEEFVSDGGFRISGLINSNHVKINFGWNSYAKEIGGENIEIRRYGLGLGYLLELFGKRDRLETDLIEGTDIYAEYTVAHIVRGTDVVIGDKCEIGLVEYSGSFKCAPGAVVKKSVKV